MGKRDQRSSNGESLLVRIGGVAIEVAPDFDPRVLTDVVRALTRLC